MGTITKALEMLNFFSRNREAIGLGEFVRLTGRDKATVHRHLVELEANGLLEQHPTTRAYRLGPAILRLSGVREATSPIRSIVGPVVTDLSEQTGELVHVSLLQGKRLSPLFHADPCRHRTQIHFDEAEMLPLHATSSGIALLAFASPDFREDVLSGDLAAYTSSTPTGSTALHRIIDQARATGIGHIERAFDQEVSSLGAPIFDASGKAIGALSVAIPTMRATKDKLDAIKPLLIEAARKISVSLGGPGIE